MEGPMEDPIDRFLRMKGEENYRRAKRDIEQSRRFKWGLWDIPHIHIILVFLLVFAYVSLVFALKIMRLM